MREIILVKSGEMALKGLNRGTFEDILMKNMKNRLKGLGTFHMFKSQSTMYIEPNSDDIDMDEALERLKTVFGIAALSKAAKIEKEFDKIQETAVEYLKEELEYAETFKVEARRSDKTFPMKSPEIQREMGAFVLQKFPHLKVDVKTPEVLVMVEIREKFAYVHVKEQKGALGMPVGSSGRAALMLSGGIDSPVAGYMMAKRGLEIVNIHFESPPYTSERAKLKVLTLAEKMSAYTQTSETLVVDLAHIQEEIKEKCKENLFTVIMRRYMMKICSRLGEKHNFLALVTGESLAQVASQTLQAITCTEDASDYPVLRPLIGFDKTEIVDIAKKIDTYETSILPYEDCCTVFTPKHPMTRPQLSLILEEEKKLEEEKLINEALESVAVYNS